MKRLLDFLRRAVEWSLRHPLGRSQWIALGVWLAVLAAEMIALGTHIARTTNTNPDSCDQGAYVLLAERNRPLPWPAATDGIRNPFFPWLVAKTAHGSPAEIFEAGKRVNVWCGALLAIALGIWAGRRLAWLPAMTFVSIGGFGVILPVSTYCGTEVLYYGLFFAAWMIALGLLARLTLSRCALVGAVLALAYLAKPGVTLFCGSFAAVALVRWFAARRETEPAGWRGARPAIGASIAVAIAAAAILPRAVDSWRRFGDPFQNTAANCFWGQDWPACYKILPLLNPRKIGQLPPDQRPTAANYLARNGWGGAWRRLTSGMAAQCGHIFSVENKCLWFKQPPSPRQPVRGLFPFRGFFLLPPLVLAAALGIAARRRLGPGAIPRAAWFQAAFIALLTAASFGAFSWYWVIAPGSRFILALYLPVFATLLCAAESFRRKLATGWSDGVCAASWLVMLTLFLTHIGIICLHPFFTGLRGSF